MKAPLEHGNKAVSLRTEGESAGTSEGRNSFIFSFNDRDVAALEGDTIGSALWASECKELRRSPRAGGPRGMFCVMGVCQECVVRVNGRLCTACNTPARPGMEVRTFVLDGQKDLK